MSNDIDVLCLGLVTSIQSRRASRSTLWRKCTRLIYTWWELCQFDSLVTVPDADAGTVESHLTR